MKKAKRLFRNNRNGFTLIELLVVITILAILAAIVGPRFFGQVEEAKPKAAKFQIKNFGIALELFYLQHGRFPTTEEGLKALREKPAGVDNWKGPYLKEDVPLDPWGNPYVYKSPGDHGDYDIISYGKDKAEGGEGENRDIVSWKDS